MSTSQWTVRLEVEADHDAVRAIHTAAFGGPDEARLVDALRAAGKAVVSLVAEGEGRAVGHVLFSPVTIEGLGAQRTALGLAPVGVLPAAQSLGAGTALIRAGLDACRALGADAAVVLGHPAYYPRFGFAPASRFGLRCEYDVPDDHFMALELTPDALHGAAGLVRYSPEFAGV